MLDESLLEVFAEETCLFFHFIYFFIDLFGCTRSSFRPAASLVVACELVAAASGI